MSLTDQQIQRYHRNIILEQVGQAGQEKLLAARVLLVGVGGLGSPAALYLTAAGIGTVGLLDGDRVEIGNLQRQLVHHTKDAGCRKVQSARETLHALNPDVTLETYDLWAQAENLRGIVRQYDFVLDCVDNFPGKFLINDACVLEQVPFCHAGILEFEGQLMTVLPGRSACYRCVFGGPPEGAAASGPKGVMGVVPGIIGTLQATEAIKALLGIGDLLTDTLLTYSALTMEFRRRRVRRRPDCPLCGPNERR